MWLEKNNIFIHSNVINDNSLFIFSLKVLQSCKLFFSWYIILTIYLFIEDMCNAHEDYCYFSTVAKHYLTMKKIFLQEKIHYLNYENDFYLNSRASKTLWKENFEILCTHISICFQFLFSEDSVISWRSW